MSKSFRALGLVGLFFVGAWYSGGGARTLPIDGSSELVAAPLAYGNLCVYFVYGPDAVSGAKVLTLQEALERELAVVHETGTVNTLAVENRSPDYELFIQSGDIVKGGRQDRVAAVDMLVLPGSGNVPLPAHCVEQGRWTGRVGESARVFQKSDAFAAGKELKYANASGQQSAVWQTVSENQSKLRANVAANVTENASPSSFQLTLEAPAVKSKVAEYEAALKTAGSARGDIVGVVFVVNGQITGAEVYGSNTLFRKAWPKLLSAAAVEAVAEHAGQATTQPPTARAIEHFLARGGESEPVGIRSSVNENALRGHGPASMMYGNVLNPNQDAIELRVEGGRSSVAPVQELLQTEGRLPVVQTEGQLVQTNDLPVTGTVFAPVTLPNPAGAVHVRGTDNERASGRVQTNQSNLRPAPPLNADGNRLSSSRAENRSTLMVESRDPARQNAVIHRSYIKK
ncbi:Hypothetical conserved protein OS=uncultured planctomycete GN=HGMM_F07G10C29 PE=4 SV=1 [Gemmata massiliana]|uniref:Hypothetical conserved protein n=1 Tax=Gemmata massiliana TaxID=1210884 RepID=A0A6P2DCL8_9BACT|nr:DUF6569 family protein [Gemmata massiliana]VTR99285.1 Hypothetical conserved protein OS=uncultured planctomycete GN=HGMM_F07G10C29 PE=4 SV=1 [Gemmata massiliana]